MQRFQTQEGSPQLARALPPIIKPTLPCIPLGSTCRPNQCVLCPLAPAKEDIDRLAFVGFGQSSFEILHPSDLCVGYPQDHIAFSQSGPCGPVGCTINANATT